MSDSQGSGPGREEWCGMTPQDRGLTTPIVDDVFEALSDWRRRAVCRYLSTCDGSAVDVETLASVVARRGQASGIPEAKTEVEAIRSELVETHLPALHRTGILDFDERSNAVKYWGSPTVEKWAEHADAVSRDAEF